MRDPSAALIDCRVIDISPRADFAAVLAIPGSGVAQYHITQFLSSRSPTSVLAISAPFTHALRPSKAHNTSYDPGKRPAGGVRSAIQDFIANANAVIGAIILR